MLNRLIRWTRKKPLHLRHEPSFIEQQHRLRPTTDMEPASDQLQFRPHPARRVPTLTLEEAKRLERRGLSADGSTNERPRLTTLNALKQIRKNKNARYTELGIH